MFPPNTLIVWNDERQNIVCQNEFDSDIKNLMVTHSRYKGEDEF